VVAFVVLVTAQWSARVVRRWAVLGDVPCSRRDSHEFPAVIALFLAATAILAALQVSGLLWWLCAGAFVPFYVWAIVAMTEAEDVKL
jgi:hypothetical protein